MGRGSNSTDAGAAPRRGDNVSPQVMEWLRGAGAKYAGDYDPNSHSVLLSEHGSCPPDVDPLAALPQGVESLPPQDQLKALVVAYGCYVYIGYGLTKHMSDPESDSSLAQMMDKVCKQMSIQHGHFDPGESAISMFESYRDKEKELHWACQRLGWPSDLVLKMIRDHAEDPPLHVAREQADRLRQRLYSKLNTSEELPPPHVEEEKELWEAYGEQFRELTDEAILADLPQGIESASVSDRLAAIASKYGETIYELQAMTQLSEGERNPMTDDLGLRLSIEAQRTGDSIETATERWSDLRSAETAQLCWAAWTLRLPATSAIEYLSKQLPVFD